MPRALNLHTWQKWCHYVYKQKMSIVIITDQGNRCHCIFWVASEFENISSADQSVTFPEPLKIYCKSVKICVVGLRKSLHNSAATLQAKLEHSQQYILTEKRRTCNPLICQLRFQKNLATDIKNLYNLWAGIEKNSCSCHEEIDSCLIDCQPQFRHKSQLGTELFCLSVFSFFVATHLVGIACYSMGQPYYKETL